MADSMDDAQDDVEVSSSPVKKMRRLRKVKEIEIEEPVIGDGQAKESEIAEKVVGDGQVRETAEEILKRFGKGDDGGKKRKAAVQRTILAAVVDMSKQTPTAITTEGVDITVAEAEGEVLVDGVEEDPLPLPSDVGEELGEDLAPLSKKKRSNTVKRCSAHATGMSFESEVGAMDGMDNDGEVKEGSLREIGNAEEGPDAEDAEDEGAASDSEKGNGDAGAGGWTDGWAEEEMSMESILAKAREMVAEMSKPEPKPIKEKKQTSEDDPVGIDDQDGKKKKSKKEEEKTKREEIYAESQRLLRESKGVAFVAPAPVMKPVSSVLEKIRQRRLQLGCSGSGAGSSQESETKSVSQRGRKDKSITHVDLTVDGDTEVEIEIFSSTLVKTEEVKTEETTVVVEVTREMKDVETAEADGRVQDNTVCDKRIPVGHVGATLDDLASGRSDKKDKNDFESSQCIMDTQELLCTSQLSAATESLETLQFESVGTTDSIPVATDSVGLDEDLTPRPVRDKAFQETDLRPSEVYTGATHVRGLIDDEAEDEDEDVLAENAEEEEVMGDDEDLRDLIAASEKDKAEDKARRDALHRKWLEQQDTEQTEDILERLRTGRSSRWKGRDRVVSCLDEDDDLLDTRGSEILDKNSSQAEEDLIEEPSISLRQRTKSQELEMDCLLDEYEDNGREEPEVEEEEEAIEDDEEHEQSIIRQRMLEESEEQLVFLSPADDESSREVLSLITKVNVGNLKTKSTTGPSEIRVATSASLPSRPSFLGRSSSSSSLPPPAHRHVGSSGSSRSFVFGRDDSNSGHGLPSNPPQEEKKAGGTKSVPDKGISSKGGKKQRPTAQPARGPSLFDMLKKQSKELEQDLTKNSASAIAKKWSSNTEAFSMFATKKSVTPSKRRKF